MKLAEPGRHHTQKRHSWVPDRLKMFQSPLAGGLDSLEGVTKLTQAVAAAAVGPKFLHQATGLPSPR